MPARLGACGASLSSPGRLVHCFGMRYNQQAREYDQEAFLQHHHDTSTFVQNSCSRDDLLHNACAWLQVPGNSCSRDDLHHNTCAWLQVPGASRIVGMRLNRRGNRLLVNCFDRTVRLYEIHQPGKRRRSYTAADLKAKLAASKVCLDSIPLGLQDTLGPNI